MLLLTACQESSKNTTLAVDTSEYLTLKSKLKELEKERDSLHILTENSLTFSKSDWFGEMESKEFEKLGIENPRNYILETLKENAAVIPLQGVLGGTMFFTNIEILSTKWVIASYEDGHIMGRAIFSYELNPNTLEVEFKVLEQVEGY